MIDNGRPTFGLILALTINGLAVSEYPEMVRVANIAESYGFESIWLCDHFLTTSTDDYVTDAVACRVAELAAFQIVSAPVL